MQSFPKESAGRGNKNAPPPPGSILSAYHRHAFDVHDSHHQRSTFHFPNEPTKSALGGKTYHNSNLSHLATRNNGRLDLSFTKCNFPEDYLPYSGTKKRSHSVGDCLEVISRDGSDAGEENLAFDSYDEDLPRPRATHVTQSKSSSLHHRLSAPFSLLGYSSLDTRKGFLSPVFRSIFHDSYGTSSNNVPLQLSSSSSSSSSVQERQDSPRKAHHLAAPIFSHHHPYPTFHDRTSRSCALARSCGCCLLVVFGVLLLISLSIVAGFSLYLTIVTNFLTEPTFAYCISGNFRVIAGDQFTIRLLNQSSSEYRRKAARYDTIVHHVLHSGLIADSLLHSEIYSFRQGSLIVFFRFYTAKATFDHIIDIKKSKTVISFGTIENVYVEDSVILGRIRHVVHDSFQQHWRPDGQLELDVDSLKVSSLERLTEPQYRQRRRVSSMLASESKKRSDNKATITANQTEGGGGLVHSITQTSQTNKSKQPSSEKTNKDDTTNRTVTKRLLFTTTTTSTTTPSTTTSSTSESTRTLVLSDSSNITIRTTSTTTTAAPTSTSHPKKKSVKKTSSELDKSRLDQFSNRTVVIVETTTISPTHVTTARADTRSSFDLLQNHTQSSSTTHSSLPVSTNKIGTISTTSTTTSTSTMATTASISSPFTTSTTTVSTHTEAIPAEPDSTRTPFTTSTPNRTLELSKFFFGGTLRNLAQIVWNKLNQDANGAEEVSAEPRDESFIVGPIDSPPTSAIDFIESTTAPNISETTTFFVNTTATIDLPKQTLPDPSSFPLNDTSVDGFILEIETANQTEPSVSQNESSTRILVISEDSFDLYSLRDLNLTTLREDEEVEDEFKLNLTSLASSSTPSPVTTLQEEIKRVDLSIGEFPENEFTQMMNSNPPETTTSASGALVFGKRISKKLQSGSSKVSHQNPSSHNNNLYNLIDEDEKVVKLKTKQGHRVVLSTTTTTTPAAPTTSFVECALGEFQCNKSHECVRYEALCDRVVDCADASDELQCTCAHYLQRDDNHRHKICDGTIDCADLSDETECPKCADGMFVCTGAQNQCIESSRVCNGENDCANGDDEQHCIALVDEHSSHGEVSHTYNPTGVLFIRHHGVWAPLCLDQYDADTENWIDSGHTNATTLSIASVLQIDDMGQAVCRANYFSQLERIQIVAGRQPERSQFFTISSNISSNSRPSLSLWSSLFEKSTCSLGKVAKIECSSLECGIRPVSSKLRRRIIGGQSTSFGSWPWQVALYREGEFQCGAVVINSQWLLTAAHCFFSSPKAYWTARGGVLRRGSLYRSFHEEIRPIDRIVIHPEYVDKGFINDIALLRLESPLRFSKYIRPICLPKVEDTVDKWQGQLCTVTGWGKLFEHGRIFPDTLQEVKLPIISTEECRKRTLFLPLYKITENMFCAGFEHGGRDACLGDSGGPMMCQKENGKWILLGITSNGDGCGRAGRPGVYTKVFNYLNWIHSVIGRDGKMDKVESGADSLTLPINRTVCSGHRCPLGKCLTPNQLCDHIIDCEDSSDELNCRQI